MEDPVPQLGDLLHQGGDDLPDGIVQGHSGEIVVRGGFGVDGDQTGTTHHGHVTQTGHRDRKSTRLNSSHVSISYAVFCLKKKTHDNTATSMQKSRIDR